MRTATKIYTFHLIQAYKGLIFSFNFYLVLVLQVCLYVSLIFSLAQSFKPKFGLFFVCVYNWQDWSEFPKWGTYLQRLMYPKSVAYQFDCL